MNLKVQVQDHKKLKNKTLSLKWKKKTEKLKKKKWKMKKIKRKKMKLPNIFLVKKFLKFQDQENSLYSIRQKPIKGDKTLQLDH